MDINSYVSQKEMKNLDWFVLLAIKTFKGYLSLATLKENNEIRCCFFFPRLPITKATINFQFPLAIKAEWPSGGYVRALGL